MLRISKVRLKNFKSFKKAEIPLVDGFTTVAGSNASGKSNISDAIVFCLGTTSLKQLRAGKLIDLINHDASEDYALVTLELKDKEKKYEITRMIDKQGRSSCRINEKKVTLSEVVMLLTELGIDSEGHNIVGQGDITSILEMNDKERRQILDDISGVREFDEKREDALGELDKVEKKLKEVMIVLNERTQFIEELSKERDSALKFQKLDAELKQSKATVLTLELSKISQSNTKLLEGEMEAIEKKEQLGEKKQENAQKLTRLQKEFDEMDAKVIGQNQKLFEEFGRKIEEKKAELKVNEERIKNREGIKVSKETEIHHFVRELDGLESEKNKMMESSSQFLPQFNEISQKMDTAKKEQENEERQKSERQKKLHELEQLLEKNGSELAKINAESAEVRKHLEELKKAAASCPTCSQELQENTKESLIKKRELLLDELQKKKILELEENERLKKESGEVKFALSLFGKKMQERYSLESQLHAIESKKIQMDSGIKGIEQKAQDYHSRRESNQKEISMLEKEIASEMNGKEMLEKELERMQQQYSKSAGEGDEFLAEREKVSNQMKESRDKELVFLERGTKLEQQLNEIRLEKSRNDVREQDLKEELQQFIGVQVLEGKELLDLKKQIPAIEKEIKDLGAINMKSLENYDSYAKELVEIKEKVDKLDLERLAVLDMANKIEDKRTQVFMNCFNAVNENFNKLYFSFFEGEAKLGLTTPEKPLESGMLIEAQYSGERLKNIDSMSGGEKSMTALAFLFAIQLYHPAPFYIFDEVDAALDKNNSMKLGAMIKQFSNDSQFVVITHNDSMIKQSDQIIGVTMNEQKSSLIGLKLKEKMEQAVAQ